MANWIAVLLGCALTLQTAVADDRSKLLGVWKLVSWEVEFQDGGERRSEYGKNPIGYIMFAPEGRMMAVLEGEGRREPKTDEERAALFRSMVAYSGVYRIEGDQWITKIDVAWNPARKVTEQVRSFKLDGERLSVMTQWQPSANLGGKITRGILTWERAR